jgi:sterol 3beta-glucosyltransferase
VVLATYGTTGDVQPMLALGAELCKRGHIIKFAAPPDFAARVRKMGFSFVPLGPPIDLAEIREVYGRAVAVADPVEHVRLTLPLVLRDAPRMVEELADSCAGADILISLPYQLAGRIVHELRHIPYVSVHLSPFGGYSRRFSAESSRLINELRGCYGLCSLRDPLGLDGSSSTLAIYAVSPTLFLRPRHWPDHHRMTGFFFLDEEWPTDASLEEFVGEREPPIVISFGSVLHQSPDELAENVMGAIRLVGRRAIVQRGWTGLQFESLPDGVYVVDFVPHSWLFPRAACVVHAGGAGTTAATLRAGTASVVVPHVLDQYLWAALLQERGCASDVIPYSQLTQERLAHAVELALGSTCSRAVALFREKLSREDGVSNAVDLVESTLKGKIRHPAPRT